LPITRGMSNFKDLVTRDIIFQIPTYQRNYSWEDKQLADLWNDLFYLESGKRHFFGTILLRSTGQDIRRRLKEFEVYEVIDGQQRIVTALILFKVILTRLESLGDDIIKEDIKREKESYLKFDDLYKVKLLGDDERFFTDNIIESITYPDEVLTPSQKRLKQAQEFYWDQTGQINDYEILKNIKLKAENMEVLVYPIEKEADAARMFTIINDRGKLLTNLERTKSFLMYNTYLSSPDEKLEQDLSWIHNRFSNIFRNVMSIEKSRWGKISEDDIQRYHYITYEKEDMITKLYKQGLINTASREKASARYMDTLKENITYICRLNKEKCRSILLDYIEDLEKAFVALREIMTYDKNDDTFELLNNIFSLGRIGNFYPLLIVSWIRFKNKEILKEILSTIEKFIFRVYVITKTRSYAGRNALYELAYKSKTLNASTIIRRLKNLIERYSHDAWFTTYLEKDDFYEILGSRDIKYLFYEYDKYLREKTGEPLTLSLSQILSRDYEVEHIWAQDTSNLELSDEEKKIHKEVKHKLGNLTLASELWNKSMGNKPFSKKRKKYNDSALRVQKELAKFENWGRVQIEERQVDLLDFALKKWRI